jgi:hypothetical protein
LRERKSREYYRLVFSDIICITTALAYTLFTTQRERERERKKKRLREREKERLREREIEIKRGD